ncbi:ATP-binding protein [Prevotella copri]|jgi:hypothetical protein|uniref:histidine kinase n=1 Tax=Segatella copri TaxID=165179 RepID=A0AAW4YK26_9BACT|nr:ATP-binding protein [Segatella copri]MCE4121591.1 ATP-binding protein [Segatella copri]MCP9497958.1 ATP-binding protein [Segatella copri]MCP9512897.1 ATP-binding protein [Segatella copri]MCP9521880.1 ATP-binding protein [Segatella copri]
MKIPFTASARTAMLIGTENFSNPEGAIIELVKNTYDADSPCCYILFDGNDGQITEIYIIDYGSGMDISTIQDCWMQIGTDDKQRNVETGNGRIKSGAKGIGRFALNRLGSMAKMYTRKEGQNAFIWNVNWKDFNVPGKKINEVMADLDVVELEEIQRCLSRLAIRFNVFLPEFSLGTILKISNLADIWEEDAIKHLFSSLQDLVPPFNIPAFQLYLYVSGSNDYGKIEAKQYEDFDYKVSAKYENSVLKVDVQRNELDINALQSEYRGLFDMENMKQFPYRLEDFEKEIYHIEMPLGELNGLRKSQLLADYGAKLGAFQFDFYFIKGSKSDINSEKSDAKYPYRQFSPTHRRLWLKKNLGVKIYRDKFRVRPYGENGDDWLHLGDRYSQNPIGAGQRMGGYHIRQNQIVGAVEISRLHNIYLQDKSGREGLQENDVFGLFKEVLLGIINIMEKDRNTVMYNLSLLYDKNHPKEDAKKQADKAQKAGEYTQANYNALSQGYTVVKQELEDKEEEVRLLRNLASTGLIITSFSHELNNLSIQTKSRYDNMLYALNLVTSIDNVKKLGLKDYQNPYEVIKTQKNYDEQVRSWLEFSINSISKDKRLRKSIHLKSYFELFKKTWMTVMNELNIDFDVKGFSDDMQIKAFVIDFDTIFNNLISNSIYAIKVKKSTINRKIRIDGKLEDEYLSIIISDSGKGLDKQYQNNPSVIFNAFESSRCNKNGEKIGTGLGLYIVKATINEYKGSSVQVLYQAEGFAIKIMFKI